MALQNNYEGDTIMNDRSPKRVRKDRPNKLELKIAAESLIDTVSKVDFSKYVKQTVKY